MSGGPQHCSGKENSRCFCLKFGDAMLWILLEQRDLSLRPVKLMKGWWINKCWRWLYGHGGARDAAVNWRFITCWDGQVWLLRQLQMYTSISFSSSVGMSRLLLYLNSPFQFKTPKRQCTGKEKHREDVGMWVKRNSLATPPPAVTAVNLFCDR